MFVRVVCNFLKQRERAAGRMGTCAAATGGQGRGGGALVTSTQGRGRPGAGSLGLCLFLLRNPVPQGSKTKRRKCPLG